MKTVEQIATEVMSALPAHLKGEVVDWPAELDNAVYKCMREYAKEKLTDVQRMIQGNDLDGIDEYIKRLKESLQ